MKALQNTLVALVREAPTEGLNELEQALAGGATDLRSCSDLPGYLIQPVIGAWRAVGMEKMPPQALAVALGTARTIQQRIEADMPKLDLVWTGPHSPAHIHTRTTASVLQEMIEAARHRILVVSYDLTRHNDLSVGIVDALAKARTNGRKITMALHDDGSNFGYVTSLWPRQLPLPRLLKWADAPTGYAKLHAKLVLVDGEDLLITSANLTLHGLQHNIEMGVRIRGRFAAEVDRHFGNLEAEGILVPFEGASR